MKHPKLFLLAAVLLAAALPSAAQEIKTACGESTYEVSKNTPRMVAMRIALTKARAQALANAFGTSTTQTDSLTAQNGEEEADRFVSSMTTVNVTGEWIANEGYDPQFGARPVKRVIQRMVLNELSKQIIAGKVDSAHTIVITAHDGALSFENR